MIERKLQKGRKDGCLNDANMSYMLFEHWPNPRIMVVDKFVRSEQGRSGRAAQMEGNTAGRDATCPM